MNLICGINPVLEAIAAGNRHFDRLLVVKGVRNRRIGEAIAAATQRGIGLRFEPRESLDRLAGGVAHQGIIAVVSAKALLDLEAVLRAVRDPGLLLLLDGVEDPRNLGAIVRTAEAAGADGVLLPDRHSAGLTETVARASAGALEHVRVARIGNAAQTVEELKQRGFWAVGLDATGGERWDAIDLRRPVVLVLGGEGRGIRRLVRERCDQVAAIPLFGHVASLNVSVAAGIALYEVVRQRGAVPSHVRPIPIGAAPPAKRVTGPLADDSETDPGEIGPLLGAVADGEGEEGEGGGEEGSDPIRMVAIDDEAAWTTGPTIVRAAGQRHGPGWAKKRRGRDQRGRPRGGGRPASAPAGRQGASAEAPRMGDRPEPAGDANAGQSRRRRRRRRGRPKPTPGG